MPWHPDPAGSKSVLVWMQLHMYCPTTAPSSLLPPLSCPQQGYTDTAREIHLHPTSCLRPAFPTLFPLCSPDQLYSALCIPTSHSTPPPLLSYPPHPPGPHPAGSTPPLTGPQIPNSPRCCRHPRHHHPYYCRPHCCCCCCAARPALLGPPCVASRAPAVPFRWAACGTGRRCGTGRTPPPAAAGSAPHPRDDQRLPAGGAQHSKSRVCGGVGGRGVWEGGQEMQGWVRGRNRVVSSKGGGRVRRGGTGVHMAGAGEGASPFDKTVAGAGFTWSVWYTPPPTT